MNLGLHNVKEGNNLADIQNNISTCKKTKLASIYIHITIHFSMGSSSLETALLNVNWFSADSVGYKLSDRQLYSLT